MWPDSDETRELLLKAEQGDADAVNNLMERHRDAVRKLIQLRLDRRLTRRVDASDVVQDVLLEASNRLGDFISDAKMPFHLWLRQLAKDRIIDMHRRHREAQRRSVDREQPLAAAGDADRSSLDLAARVVARELTPAAASIRREMEQQFLEALDQLDEDDRELILMRHYEHLGNSEVAGILEITPAAAGMRHLRALRRLRSLLGDPEEEDRGVE